MSPRVLSILGRPAAKADCNTTGALEPDSDPDIPDCTHDVTEPRVRTLSNGVKQHVVQCLGCGQQMQHIVKSDWAARQIAELNPPFDLTLRDDYYARRQAAWDAWRARKNDAWRREYDAYMESDAWWERREKRLELDSYQCQAQLAGCKTYAQHVHHLSYANLGDEPLWELVSVCVSCHDIITARNRLQRGTA